MLFHTQNSRPQATPRTAAVTISMTRQALFFGAVFAAVAYAFTGGKRDFSSATAIVAGRYDILCEPDAAPEARDLIAEAGGTTSARENVIGE